MAEAALADTEDDPFGGTESGDGRAGLMPERVLNQEEIDSLLGFDEEHDDSGDQSGIQAILSSALVSYERLPMLEVVFDRLVRLIKVERVVHEAQEVARRGEQARGSTPPAR